MLTCDRVDIVIMPLLICGFFALQLDRGNIGNALTDSLLADVGISQNQFNVGQQLLSAGIVILEVSKVKLLNFVGTLLNACRSPATSSYIASDRQSGLVARLWHGTWSHSLIPMGALSIDNQQGTRRNFPGLDEGSWAVSGHAPFAGPARGWFHPGGAIYHDALVQEGRDQHSLLLVLPG